MDSAERNKRVVELLTRRDEIDEELAVLDRKMGDLAMARDEVQGELAQVMGVAAATAGDLKQGREMTCGTCKTLGLDGKGHTARTHDRWLAEHPEIRAKLVGEGKLKPEVVNG